MTDIKKDTRDKLVQEIVKKGVDRREAERHVDVAIARQNAVKKGEK